ncbi:heme peroxidase [Tothia fuscella]|uniref:Heme peroxidase n=1 Tax=Tothia fuscella TaxID=1048955 RepID=A0A9P4NYI5_9PEZI|nr:heme peroxidase [Tothia fuscella]
MSSTRNPGSRVYVATATKFPDNSRTGKKVTDAFLTQLYNDLQHPPISYLGEHYKYRSADGSYNSLVHPNLGKAGTPYARTCAPKAMQPGALPDPGVIFDSIMARKDKNREQHPNQISSVLFYLASIIIHDLFRTDHAKFAVSKTSSYLDLSPLYGSNLEEQIQMRTGNGGRLKPDCFSEVRLLAFPPGVGALLIMFNRFHNNVVEQLATINEKNQFKKPDGNAPEIDTTKAKWRDDFHSNHPDWAKYDENLFQTGRLITGGLYINMILLDYVRTILNLNKTNSNWALNPRADIKETEVASGNQVSAEFNLVYRWHSAISARDEKWTEDFWAKNFPGVDPTKQKWHDFAIQAGDIEKKLLAQDPMDRDFDGLQRQADGTFNDDDLVRLISSSVEDCANSYGANRVPIVLRVVEQLGIMQARAWNVASLNEFRKYFGLKPHEKFTDINPDESVAKQLERLYDHPDQVELYPGLVAERTKEPRVPGAGLSPSFTVSRAVLSDAVALVRGDRFYTVDYHPKKLTNWGYTAAGSDVAIDNGCVSYKLFLTVFPRHFRPNSIYAHYPMTIPGEMAIVMKTLGRYNQYNWDKPGKLPDTQVAFSYAACKSILTNSDAFKITWNGNMEYLMGPSSKEFMRQSGGPKDLEARKAMQQSLYKDGKWESSLRQYFEKATKDMLKKKAYSLANFNQVDIVRDIGNLVSVHFVSELFSLPLKTEKHPLGTLTEHEMYLVLLAICTSFLKETDSVDAFRIRQLSYTATQSLGKQVQFQIDDSGRLISVTRLLDALSINSPIEEYGDAMVDTLLKAGLDSKHIVWGHILSTASGIVATQGQLFANVLEYFIKEGSPPQILSTINKLAKQDSDSAFEELMHFALEAARLSHETAVYRTVATPTTLPDNNGTLNVKPGDRVLLNLKAASLDPKIFLEPNTFDPTRNLEDYVHIGMGPHDNLGAATTRIALTAMLKMVARLDGLRPATGPQGLIHKIPRVLPGGARGVPYNGFLTENWDGVWPVPQTMKVNWN